MRVGGLNALRKWIGEDERIIESVMESEMMGKCVYILSRKTIESERSKDGITSSSSSSSSSAEQKKEEEEEEEEEGVSVSEKNGILGIVLEVVEGGGWKGSYSELEEVVGRLEEEGKKRRTESNGAKGQHGWKEMGRLAHEVGWAIEERKLRDGRGGDGEMITLQGMKKNLEEKDKQLEEEKKGREEEKRKKEESEREKRGMEERIRSLEREVNETKRLIEMHPTINSLSHFNLYFSNSSNLTFQGNTITHVGSHTRDTCVFKEILEPVYILTSYRLLLLFLF